MKILLFSDVHVGTSSESTTNPGHIRLASTEALETLKKNIATWNTKHYDYIFQMGDILREMSDHDSNIKHISQAAEAFSAIKHPLIHVLGNHDIRAASKEVISEIFTSHNLDTQFFGRIVTNGYKCIWLDSELDENKRGYITSEQLTWLKSEIKEKVPTIIFSHHSIVPQNAESNFYFSKTGEDMFHTNSDAILNVIKDNNVIACINVHCHWFSYKKVEGIHFITNPAFSENIAAMDYPDNNPGVYSTLEITDNKLLFKSFSKEFAFVNLELELD